MYRQGDVLIIPAHRAAPSGPELPRDDGRVVLAYGESTGHAHAIDGETAHLYPGQSGDRVLVIDPGGASLRHEEHATIELPAGEYVVRRQREYVPSVAEGPAGHGHVFVSD